MGGDFVAGGVVGAVVVGNDAAVRFVAVLVLTVGRVLTVIRIRIRTGLAQVSVVCSRVGIR